MKKYNLINMLTSSLDNTLKQEITNINKIDSKYFKLVIKNKEIFLVEKNTLLFGNQLYKNLILKIQNKIKTAVWTETIGLDVNYLFKSFNDFNKDVKISYIEENQYPFKEIYRFITTENGLEKVKIPSNKVFKDIFMNEIKEKFGKKKNIEIDKEKIGFISLSNIDYIYSFYKETNRAIFEYQSKNISYHSRSTGVNLKVGFEQHLFAYNQFLSLISKLFEIKKGINKDIDIIKIDNKNYNLQDLLVKLYNNIIYLVLSNSGNINFSSKTDFILLSDKKIYNYIIKDGKVREEKQIDNLTFEKILYAIFEQLVLNNYFGVIYLDYIKSKYLGNKQTKKKEYAKVWQEDNLRVNNQTSEILSQIKKQLPQKVNNFISLFKGFEIDERTDLEKIDDFFKTYYDIMNFIGNKLSLDYKTLVGHIMLKIRKLGQYRATGIYISNFKILAIDTRTWQSLVHETGHFIHFILAEKYLNSNNNINSFRKYTNIMSVVFVLPQIIRDFITKQDLLEYRKKKEQELKQGTNNTYGMNLNKDNYKKSINDLEKIVSILKVVNEQYKNVALYFLLVSKANSLPKKSKTTGVMYGTSMYTELMLNVNTNISLGETINLIDKINKLYESKVIMFRTYKGGWSNYAGTSVEIFARLFDYSVSNLLKKDSKDLYNKLKEETVDIATLDKVSSNTVQIDPQKELSIKAIDLGILDILENDLGIKKETIYQEFLDLIKNEINFDKSQIFG